MNGIIPFSKIREVSSSIADVLPTVKNSAETTFTLAVNEVRNVSGTPASLSVTLAAPSEDKDCMYSLNFQAGASFAFEHEAPTGYTIEWGGDEPTWTAGNVYEIIYRYLHVQHIISAKYSEVERSE